jgi:hypothetical protein
LFYQKIERLINNQKKEKEDENGLEKGFPYPYPFSLPLFITIIA